MRDFAGADPSKPVRMCGAIFLPQQRQSDALVQHGICGQQGRYQSGEADQEGLRRRLPFGDRDHSGDHRRSDCPRGVSTAARTCAPPFALSRKSALPEPDSSQPMRKPPAPAAPRIPSFGATRSPTSITSPEGATTATRSRAPTCARRTPRPPATGLRRMKNTRDHTLASPTPGGR